MIINNYGYSDIQKTQAIIIYSYLCFQADIHPFFRQPFPLTGDALLKNRGCAAASEAASMDFSMAPGGILWSIYHLVI